MNESIKTRQLDDWFSPWLQGRLRIHNEFLELPAPRGLLTRRHRRSRYPSPDHVYSVPLVVESDLVEPPTWGVTSVDGFINRGHVTWWPTYTEEGSALCAKPA